MLGLFIYTGVILPLNLLTNHQVGFSAIAGALALALLVIPVVVRTTDEMLQLQPPPCARRPWHSVYRSGS